jgi:hypothetical protein
MAAQLVRRILRKGSSLRGSAGSYQRCQIAEYLRGQVICDLVLFTRRSP